MNLLLCLPNEKTKDYQSFLYFFELLKKITKCRRFFLSFTGKKKIEIIMILSLTKSLPEK